MTKLLSSEQSGRSMVEMLGVLAIIGVLSIGGISGYSKAMSKYRTNKAIDQVSLLITNIRTLYANQNNYTGLDSTQGVLETFELVSQDMIAGSNKYVNPFGGDVTVKVETDVTRFTVTYDGIDKQSCISIVTADWGASASGGLDALTIGGNKHTWGASGTGAGFPIDLNTAASQCSPAEGKDAVSIAWTYR